MDLQVIAAVGSLMSLIVSGYAIYVGKRKTKAEAKKLEAEAAGIDLENDEKEIKLYKLINEDLTNQLKDKIKELTEVKAYYEVKLADEIRSNAELMRDLRNSYEDKISTLRSQTKQ